MLDVDFSFIDYIYVFFLPNVFNGFISLLWYIRVQCSHWPWKIRSNFFLLYLRVFWINPLFKCRPVLSVRNTLKKSFISFTSSFKKHSCKSVRFFFYSSSLHVGFKKNVPGQIEIEPYVQQIETFVVRIFITMYLGHSNLHLGSTGYLKNY